MSFHLPSAYGFTIWLTVSLLLIVVPSKWGGPNNAAIAISCFVAFAYLTSNIIFSKIKLKNKIVGGSGEGYLNVGVIFLMIGIAGAVSNIIELMIAISSAGIDFILITGEVLRRESANVESVGQQISYFGWFGSYLVLSCLGYERSSKKKFFYMVLIVSLVSIEFAQMNRMRVIWLIVLLSYAIVRVQGFKIKYFTGLIAIIFLVFILSGILTNKISADDLWGLIYSSYLQVSAYFIGGSLFFVNELRVIEDFDISFKNTLRPIYKILYSLGVIPLAPTSGILDFKVVGGDLVTNVGSFLLSFVNDFGSVGVVVAVVSYTLIIDLIFVYLHKKQTVVVGPLMASLIFIAIMSPFASQHESMAFMVILVLSLSINFIYSIRPLWLYVFSK